MTTTPNPRTLKNEELADRYGAISARIALLEEQKKGLKLEFLRRGFTTVDGKRYRLTRYEAQDGTMLDVALIREVHSTEWIEKFSKPTHSDAYCKVSAIVGTRTSKPRRKPSTEVVAAKQLAEVM